MSLGRKWALGAVLVSGLAQGADPAELRGQVNAYLSSIDTPITKAQWKALGPEAAPLLQQIATSSESLPLRRARAIDGWSAVAGAAGSDWLVTLAKSEQEQFVVRRSALRASQARMGAGQFLQTFQPLLTENSDPRIQNEAGQALIARAPTQGCAAVRSTIAAQRQPGESLLALLKRCGAKP